MGAELLKLGRFYDQFLMVGTFCQIYSKVWENDFAVNDSVIHLFFSNQQLERRFLCPVQR